MVHKDRRGFYCFSFIDTGKYELTLILWEKYYNILLKVWLREGVALRVHSENTHKHTYFRCNIADSKLFHAPLYIVNALIKGVPDVILMFLYEHC